MQDQAVQDYCTPDGAGLGRAGPGCSGSGSLQLAAATAIAQNLRRTLPAIINQQTSSCLLFRFIDYRIPAGFPKTFAEFNIRGWRHRTNRSHCAAECRCDGPRVFREHCPELE